MQDPSGKGLRSRAHEFGIAGCRASLRRSLSGLMLAALLATSMAMGLLASGSAHSATKTVLVLGDSLSAEYGLPRGTGWVSLLEKSLKTEKPSMAIINASIRLRYRWPAEQKCC